MHLNCPECTTHISSDGINITKAIAICKHCDNIFEFEQELVFEREQELEFQRERELPAPRFEVIPPGIELLRLSYELEIMINWRKSAKNWLFFFALFWNAFISIFMLIVVFTGEVFPILFMIPFVLVGVYLLYASVGYLINTTYITVNERSLSVEHKPINFLVQRDKYYTISDISQFYVRRYVVGTSNDVPVHAFALDMILKKGKTIPLIKQMHSAEHAKFIEAELEHFMRIKNRAVEGEWK